MLISDFRGCFYQWPSNDFRVISRKLQSEIQLFLYPHTDSQNPSVFFQCVTIHKPSGFKAQPTIIKTAHLIGIKEIWNKLDSFAKFCLLKKKTKTQITPFLSLYFLSGFAFECVSVNSSDYRCECSN